jgi:FKBP-type peptidyl-prolyl cis-trans isomerase
MKRCLIALTVVFALVLGSCGSNMKNVKIKTKADSLSYAFGIVNYNALALDSIELDPSVVAKAMEDGRKGEPLMEDMDARSFIMAYINERDMLKAEQKAILDKELYKEHIAQNEEFLRKNSEKQGVQVTSTGLQYEVIKQGNGEKPTTESTVSVHYVGTTIDGTKFDSSYDRGQPAQFPILGVIPGWTEALQLMPTGSKYKLYIPEKLAYGAAGAGDVIKPYSTLIFEVELLEIVK